MVRHATGKGREEIPESTPKIEQEQLPPGQMIQIVSPESPESEHRLLLGSPTDYRDCFPIWPDFEAHLPINYCRGLLLSFASGLRKVASELPPEREQPASPSRA